jgi:hypothetical protein
MDVLIDGGRRTGHGQLTNEAAFHEALANGDKVYTQRKGVYFSVTLVKGRLVYTALAFRPVSLD